MCYCSTQRMNSNTPVQAQKKLVDAHSHQLIFLVTSYHFELLLKHLKLVRDNKKDADKMLLTICLFQTTFDAKNTQYITPIIRPTNGSNFFEFFWHKILL